jgi:type VI protein secretion system component VasF
MPDPDADEGPQRFIRNWLRFDEHAPRRKRTTWKLVAAVMLLLIVSAVLALFSAHLQR